MRRLLTPGWLVGHALVVAAVAVCLGLGWWQAGRASDGNTLSWAYTFEWPLFAIFTIVLWIREMRQTLAKERGESTGRTGQAPATGRTVPRRPVITRRVSRPTAGPHDHSDPQLAEYNRYLAWLNQHPEAKPGDYPVAQLAPRAHLEPKELR